MVPLVPPDPADGQPADDVPRCSVLARATGEPMAGTAPQASVWVGVEQPGPWGPRPLQRPSDSHLPDPVRKVLATVDGLPGVKVLLLRRPGRHADAPEGPTHRQVLLSVAVPGHRFVVSTTCRTDEELLALDLPASAAAATTGAVPGWGRPVDDPVTLVCTNGRRDRCCAIAGRPAAAWLGERWPGSVWECSHVGGHRFASTALVLPAGAVYGGLDGPALEETVTELAGRRLPLPGLRGLTVLGPEQQVADVAVRSAAGLGDLDATVPGPPQRLADELTQVVVGTPTGGRRVLVRRVPGPARAESCSKPPVPRTDLVADAPVPV